MAVNTRKILITGFLCASALLSAALFVYAPASPSSPAMIAATEPTSGHRQQNLIAIGDSAIAGRREGVRVIDHVRSGATSREVLRAFDADLSHGSKRGQSVLIFVGVNDLKRYGASDASMVIGSAQQRANLAALIEKAKAVAPQVIVVGTLPVDEERTSRTPTYFLRNADVRAQNDMKQELCAEYGVKFINPYDDFLQAGGPKLLADGVRPNAAGHQWLATFFGKKLSRLG